MSAINNIAEQQQKGELMKNTKIKAFDIHVSKCDFYSMSLSNALRQEIVELNERDDRRSALDYDRSLGDLYVIVELMDLDLYWAYLKDYNFGHMKPLGKCIYDFKLPGEPEMPKYYEGEEYIPAIPDFGLNEENHPRDEDYERKYSEWRETFTTTERLMLGVLPDLSSRIESGEIDITQEAFDYYHRIPSEPIPRVKDRMLELISVQEAAKILNVTNSRVKKMVADKVLDGFTRDGKLYLSKQGVVDRSEYIKKHGKPTRGKAKSKGENK